MQNTAGILFLFQNWDPERKAFQNYDSLVKL